jgi:predicted membrane protein
MGIFSIIGFVVVVLWIIGLIGHIGGAFINIPLVVALIMLAMHFFGGRSHTNDI